MASGRLSSRKISILWMDGETREFTGQTEIREGQLLVFEDRGEGEDLFIVASVPLPHVRYWSQLPAEPGM